MKNLAGAKDADNTIREELYLAGIETIPDICNGEVRTTIGGGIGNWKLHRAWSYWVASTEILSDGLPLEAAMELHNTKHPLNDDVNLGNRIRSGGHCGCPSPDEYGADPDYEDKDFIDQLKALGYKEQYFKTLDKSFIDITCGEVSKICNEGKVSTSRYVTIYHIDNQVGLCEFAKYLNAWYDYNN